jgi:sarcosine oxidase
MTYHDLIHRFGCRWWRCCGHRNLSFVPTHDKGSSHGESRIIRQAYFEDPAYVPLVLRAYELWDELQNESNEEILSITGGVAIGSSRRALITGCLKSATRYGLEHDLLSAREMRQRFPQFALADNEVAFFEEKAGYLKPEECIRQYLRCASKRGADLCFEEPVLSWRASRSGGGVSVTTEKQTSHAISSGFPARPIGTLFAMSV